MKSIINDLNFPLLGFLKYLTENILLRDISVRETIRVQDILKGSTSDITFDKVKYLITPIIARNEFEQKLLYEAFDTFFSEYLTKRETKKDKTPVSRETKKDKNIYHWLTEKGKNTYHWLTEKGNIVIYFIFLILTFFLFILLAYGIIEL